MSLGVSVSLSSRPRLTLTLASTSTFVFRIAGSWAPRQNKAGALWRVVSAKPHRRQRWRSRSLQAPALPSPSSPSLVLAGSSGWPCRVGPSEGAEARCRTADLGDGREAAFTAVAGKVDSVCERVTGGGARLAEDVSRNPGE